MNRVETNLKTAIRTIAALCLLLAMLVSATATAQDSFSPNFGVSGSWVNPDSPGQGFFFDVNPETGLFWASWFTYTDEETTHSPVIGAVDNDWFVALGTLDGTSTVTLAIIKTTGGAFDASNVVSEQEVGTLVLDFDSCKSATAQYSFENPDVSGELTLERLTSVELCENLLAAQ